VTAADCEVEDMGVGADAGVVAEVRASLGETALVPLSLSRLSLSRSRSRSRATASTYPPTSVATWRRSFGFDKVKLRNNCKDSEVGEEKNEGR